MAKFRQTLSSKIAGQAMLNGHKWQRACIVSIVINIILLSTLIIK